VLGIFSIIAIILAGSGIYGVMAYSVSQQTHEIGVRMAFGADQRQILGLIIWKALKLTLFGVAAGITTALLLTRFMASLLYDLKATDIVTFSITALAIIAIALLASFLPAYRATKVDPLVALRRE
jgi:putative ABC transport system permease protein